MLNVDKPNASARPPGTRPVIVNGKIEWIPIPKRAPPLPPSSSSIAPPPSSSSSFSSTGSAGFRLQGPVTFTERVSEAFSFILHHRWTLLGLISYVCLVRYINDHKWGAVITMLFAILAMVTVGLSKSSGDLDSLSPYQILNRGAQSLAGQYHASALDRERRFGPGGVVKEDEEFANVFAGGGRRGGNARGGNVLGGGGGDVNNGNTGLRQRINAERRDDGKSANEDRKNNDDDEEEEEDEEEDEEIQRREETELEEAIARSLSER